MTLIRPNVYRPLPNPKAHRVIRVKIIAEQPVPGCPYCGEVDSAPATHIAEGRCK